MSSKTVQRAAMVCGVTVLSVLPLAGTVNAATPDLQARALGIAKHQIGKPYVYGAAGPRAFDCSGLVYYSYKHSSHGKTLPRIAQSQYNHSKKITFSHRKPGDMVFFGYSKTSIFHVGMYAGTDKKHEAVMIAAPYPGKNVRYEVLYHGYWKSQQKYGVHLYYGRA